MPELTTNLKNILIAAVLAIAAVALTLIYVSNSNSKHSSTSPATYRTVLVAARDIPVGTTGAQLAHAGWLTTRRIPSDAIASGVVPNRAALATLVAIQPTYHGEQIVARRFGTSQQEGLVSTIHGQLGHIQLYNKEHIDRQEDRPLELGLDSADVIKTKITAVDHVRF